MKIMRLQDEAIESLRGMKFFSGKLDETIIKKLPMKEGTPNKVSIDISPVAWMKMVALISGFSSEVGWQGTCVRNEEDDSKFFLEDVYVYPQIVTGTTIDTDETQHGQWLDKFDDETFKKLRFHGHSHVNMSVFSSGTDDDLQRDLVDMLKEGDFYLFFIMNKRLEIFIRLYDNKYGVIYETADCSITVGGADIKMTDFMKEARSCVKNNTPTYTGNYYGCYYNGYNNGGYQNGGYTGKQDEVNKGQTTITLPTNNAGKEKNASVKTDYDSPYGYYDKNGHWVSVVRS